MYRRDSYNVKVVRTKFERRCSLPSFRFRYFVPTSVHERVRVCSRRIIEPRCNNEMQLRFVLWRKYRSQCNALKKMTRLGRDFFFVSSFLFFFFFVEKRRKPRSTTEVSNENYFSDNLRNEKQSR